MAILDKSGVGWGIKPTADNSECNDYKRGSKRCDG